MKKANAPAEDDGRFIVVHAENVLLKRSEPVGEREALSPALFYFCCV
ncbi:hypothetical protein KR50_14030 [Jeotgalibacillus campisalis]|uniref:Uncharacterized protein n=1 Tax=Jeotgalibacillus campisalis TaxID=220754 RepID=A0A0C2VHL7_9BACL|nr:hypothetical protein KR50_14030 [Jeotgalibacillus campisalis]